MGSPIIRHDLVGSASSGSNPRAIAAAAVAAQMVFIR